MATKSKKEETPVKETRQKKMLYVGNQIIEVSASTKRKPAYMKIAINDDLAQKIMKGRIFGSNHADGFPTIMSLYLTYEENLT